MRKDVPFDKGQVRITPVPFCVFVNKWHNMILGPVTCIICHMSYKLMSFQISMDTRAVWPESVDVTVRLYGNITLLLQIMDAQSDLEISYPRKAHRKAGYGLNYHERASGTLIFHLQFSINLKLLCNAIKCSSICSNNKYNLIINSNGISNASGEHAWALVIYADSAAPDHPH